ncbi:MAG: HPr family phosphocarrier protein [Acidobacteria bacterium]|nr:HPr family phosphocarrier protein [Acidobacteriota bacterium]
MIRQVIEVENRLGLHARAAAKLVRMVSTFHSRVTIGRDGDAETVSGDSILGILMLAAPQGSRLIFLIEGTDEVEASQAIRKLFAERFGEDS